jgi:hypothetical protein
MRYGVIYRIELFYRFIYHGENHGKPGIGSVCQFRAEDLLREVWGQKEKAGLGGLTRFSRFDMKVVSPDKANHPEG